MLCFFNDSCVRSKRRVRSHVVKGEIKNCTPLWRKADLEVKQVSFGALFEVQMSKNSTPLWRKADLEVKHVSFGALFEVQMSKNCTPLCRKADFGVKMCKARRLRSVFWSSENCTCTSQNVQNTSAPKHFLSLRCRTHGSHSRLVVITHEMSSTVRVATCGMQNAMELWC